MAAGGVYSLAYRLWRAAFDLNMMSGGRCEMTSSFLYIVDDRLHPTSNDPLRARAIAMLSSSCLKTSLNEPPTNQTDDGNSLDMGTILMLQAKHRVGML